MKKIYYTLLLLVISISSNAQCPNGNAEQGNFTNWNIKSGIYTTPLNSYPAPTSTNSVKVIPNIPAYTDVLAAGVPSIMITNNIDTYGAFPVPNEGTYAFRIGNNTNGTKLDGMHYSFLVTNANRHFKFRYAVVFNDAGHPENEQPDFLWFMNVQKYPWQGPHFPSFSGGIMQQFYNHLDQNLYFSTYTRIVADGSNPFFQTSVKTENFTKVLFKAWQCVEYDLSDYVGRNVTIYFQARDCSRSGHFGYAYIDGLCDAWPATASFTLKNKQVCDNGQPLIMDGTASTGEDRYFIEIAESNNATGSSLNTSNIISGWTYGQQAGVIDLSAWYQSHGGIWKCNKYYKIKLAVQNDCAIWNEQSQIIYFSCPTINAGPDKFLCCKSGNSVTIGTAPIAGMSYSWSSIPAGFTSNSAQVSVSPDNNTTYILSAVDANGCRAKDEVDVTVKTPIHVSIQYDQLPSLSDCNGTTSSSQCHSNAPRTVPRENSCNGLLNAIATPLGCNETKPDEHWITNEQSQYSYLWSTGATSQSIAPIIGVSSYTVTVSNGCNTATAIITGVVPNNYFSQPIPTIAAPNGINLSGTYAQQVCKFYEYGASAPTMGTGPAYNAYRYRLRIFDRWGNMIYCKEECSKSGFPNGYIQWDARNDNGTLVSQDTYTAQLTLWNCKTPATGSYFPVLRGQKYICTHQHWVWFPLPHRECDAGYWQDVYEQSNVCKITVVY